jgi:hypothetical protein
VKISSFSFGVFSFFLSGFKNPSNGLDFYFSFARFQKGGGGCCWGAKGRALAAPAEGNRK